jgi:phytoene synthase
MTGIEIEADRNYCADALRRLDPDRWLTALFAPQDRRGDLVAIYAFNLELALVRESVSEPLLGDIRLQWWRDALAAIHAGDRPTQPVARALAAAIRRRGLPQPLLAGLIEARARDLDPAPPATLADLVAYAEACAAPPLLLALGVVEADEAAARRAARFAATAFALAGLMRAVPMHLAQRRIWLPRDLLAAEGLSAENLALPRDAGPLRRAVAPVAAEALRALDAVRTERGRLGKAAARRARPVLLHAALAGLYLRRLVAAGFDPASPLLRIGTPRKQLALIAAIAGGGY